MIELARELGLALANSDEFNKMAAARRNMNEDPALLALMEEFQAKKDALLYMMQNGDENLSEASNDLDRLQGQLFENPIFMDLVDAENEFQNLLTEVNAEISKCISAADPSLQNRSGCSGHCGGCHGCTH